jgi:hypothetical protein
MGMLDTLYKGYVLKGAVKDMASFVKENVSDMEWNKNYWLRKVGLSTYSPGRSVFGGFSLLILGAAVGAVAALAFAPKPGPQLRAEVKDKAMTFMNKAPSMMDPPSARM